MPPRKPFQPTSNPHGFLISRKDTIVVMALGIFFMHVLEVMFFVGMAGSSIVVIISFVEDAHELFGKD
jgi:hypothetical protein